MYVWHGRRNPTTPTPCGAGSTLHRLLSRCLITLLSFRVLLLSFLAQLTPIAEGGGPDVAEWNKIMEPYLGESWLDTPWLYSEFYAYRRVVEAFSFFETGKRGGWGGGLSLGAGVEGEAVIRGRLYMKRRARAGPVVVGFTFRVLFASRCGSVSFVATQNVLAQETATTACSVDLEFRCGYRLGRMRSSSPRFSPYCCMHVHQIFVLVF